MIALLLTIILDVFQLFLSVFSTLCFAAAYLIWIRLRAIKRAYQNLIEMKRLLDRMENRTLY